MHYFQCPHCKKQLEREEEQPRFCDPIMYHCFSVLLMMFDFSLSFSGAISIVNFTKKYPDNYDNKPSHYYPITLLTIIVALINLSLLIMYSRHYFLIWKYKPLYSEEQVTFNHLCNQYVMHIARLITYTAVVIFSSVLDEKPINVYYSVISFCMTIPYILLMFFVQFFFNFGNSPTILINPRSCFYKYLNIRFENVDQSTIDVDSYLV
jgi:hypothetical protein